MPELLSIQDLSDVVNDPIFIEGVRHAVELSFNPCPDWYRGDINFDGVNECDYYEKAKDQPLAYISSCEEVTQELLNSPANFFYDKDGIINSINSDKQLRDAVLRIAYKEGKNHIAWWFYPHACETEALFISLVIAKVKFPQYVWCVASTNKHRFIMSSDEKYYIDPVEDICHRYPYIKGNVIPSNYSAWNIKHIIDLNTTPTSLNDNELELIYPSAIVNWYKYQYDHDINIITQWVDKIKFYKKHTFMLHVAT